MEPIWSRPEYAAAAIGTSRYPAWPTEDQASSRTALFGRSGDCRRAAVLPRVMVSAARTARAGPQMSEYAGKAITVTRMRPVKPTALPMTER